jgi:[acyl-carrier-protein] S-malonyltransferase
MGHDLFGQFATADRLFEQAADALNLDLVALCLEGSGRKYVSPRHEAQSIYVVECAYAAVLSELGYRPVVTVGHSLGSWGAAQAAGAFDFLTGLRLVSAVEDLLEAMPDRDRQAMGVLIGLDANELQGALRSVPGVYHANWNSPLQHVISGDAVGVDAIIEQALSRPVKQARRLASGRALHSPLVAEVANRLSPILEQAQWCEPRVPLIDCESALPLTTAPQVRGYLARFLARPVLWEKAVRSLMAAGNTHLVEVGPGNVLTGMMPFIDSGLRASPASDHLAQRVAV